MWLWSPTPLLTGFCPQRKHQNIFYSKVLKIVSKSHDKNWYFVDRSLTEINYLDFLKILPHSLSPEILLEHYFSISGHFNPRSAIPSNWRLRGLFNFPFKKMNEDPILVYLTNSPTISIFKHSDVSQQAPKAHMIRDWVN